MKAHALAVALLVVGLLAPGQAAAAPPTCGQAIIADWADDGRISGSYPPRCYGAALRALPEDVRAYSTAVEDITLAMHARIGTDARDDGNEGNTALGTGSDGGSGGPRQLSSSGDERPDPTPVETDGGLAGAVADAVPGLLGSVPFPLALAAVLMLLLGLAGSTGLIARGHR